MKPLLILVEHKRLGPEFLTAMPPDWILGSRAQRIVRAIVFVFAHVSSAAFGRRKLALPRRRLAQKQPRRLGIPRQTTHLADQFQQGRRRHGWDFRKDPRRFVAHSEIDHLGTPLDPLVEGISGVPINDSSQQSCTHLHFLMAAAHPKRTSEVETLADDSFAALACESTDAAIGRNWRSNSTPVRGGRLDHRKMTGAEGFYGRWIRKNCGPPDTLVENVRLVPAARRLV